MFDARADRASLTHGQGVLPHSPRLNWYGSIPQQHEGSENKDEVYSEVC